MNNFKLYVQKNKAIILLSLGLALATGATGYSIFSKILLEKQIQHQNTESKEMSEKILAMTDTIGKLEVEKSEAAKEILRLQSGEDDSKSKIEAFAKQAASCDRIKKRLHIKE